MTEADITAEREMCGWFNAQFDTLMGQINAFNADLAANQDNYAAPGIQHQADAVTVNIDQSEQFRSSVATIFAGCGSSSPTSAPASRAATPRGSTTSPSG